MKDPVLYAVHVLESIDLIYTYAKEDPTLEKSIVYDAILRKLQVMADAVKFLDTALKEANPLIEWRKIIGFRNILVHDYLGEIDRFIIINIIEKELRPLEKAIREFYAKNQEMMKKPNALVSKMGSPKDNDKSKMDEKNEHAKS